MTRTDTTDDEPFTIQCHDCDGEYHPDHEGAKDHDEGCPVRRAKIKMGKWEAP